MAAKLDLSRIAKDFQDEDKARQLIEEMRWPEGPVCPHCRSHGAYRLTPKEGSKTRKGLLKCKVCRRQFTVTVGTIFEDSHIPLSKWLLALYLVSSSKKGVSANQLRRMLSITYQSAWFMAHRIRYAMGQPPLSTKMKGIIEADETYIGGREKGPGKTGRGSKKKVPVFALVERGGRVFATPVQRVTARNLKKVIHEQVDKRAQIMTDDFPSYRGLAAEYTNHFVVKHSKKEYVRGQIHTNTVEGFFSLLKRGVNGTFHHVSKQHLHRYLDEFSFRYNLRKLNDGAITRALVQATKGKRLTFKEPLNAVATS